MPKQTHRHNDLKGKILSGLTVLSLVSVPFVWKMPNILPLVSVGGLASSTLYYRKVGYRPSKLEKQFIETKNKLAEQAQQLKSDRELLDIEKTNLKSNFDKWRDEELVRIEQIRKNRLDDAEKIIQSKLSEVEELAKSKIQETNQWIAQQRRELERRGQELIDREESLEQRALAIAEQIKQTEAESIKRIEEREVAGLAELQEKADTLEAYRQQLEKDRQALEQEKIQLIEEIQAVERQWEQKWLEQEERHQEDYKQIEQVYSNVAGSYAAENWALKRPDYFDPPTNTEEYAANDVMRVLSQHDIFAKAPILKSNDRGFKLSFKVLPVKFKVKGEDIPEKSLSAGEAYKIINGKLIPDLAATVPGCESPPVVKPTYQGIEIYFDTTGVNWEEIEPRSANSIHESSSTIFDLFASTYHIGLEGATGRGKTTTTKNILRAMAQELGEDNLTIKVGTGKPDDGLREFDTVVGNKKALTLLKFAADLVQERLDIHISDWDAQRPLTKFKDKFIFFFDEISDLAEWANSNDPEVKEFLIDNGFPLDKKGEPVKDIVGLLLKRCWRLGRSLGIMILIAGQNLNASALGVQVIDLENMGMIYVGTGAKKGIEVRGLRSEKNYFHKQYSLRVMAGQEFFAFFVTGAGDCWLAALPEHGWDKFAMTISQSGQEFEAGQGRSASSGHPEVPNSGGQNPDWDEVKRKLEESLRRSDEVNQVEGYDLKIIPWKSDADPKKLVDSARPRIEKLVREGMINPKQIAIKIWGDVVDTRKKPYNGKPGAKHFIELIIKEIQR
jgi:hypothetical protein